MIFITLFFVFLKIGAFTFGGGYVMISLIRDECLAYGWLTEEELLDLVAVSESTPGPIAVNMATFVGSSQGGILGAAAATFGVVLPSFIIIILVAAVLKNLLKYAGVKACLGGVRPAVVALIIATATTMMLGALAGYGRADGAFDIKALIILAVLTAISLVFKKIKKKTFSPVLLILISGAMGILLYGI